MYILINADEYNDFKLDLQNFIDIENVSLVQLIKIIIFNCNYFTKKLKELEAKVRKQKEIDYDDESIKDEINFLNNLMPAYEKNGSKITCHTAIDLLNRWVNTLDKSTCGSLYPCYFIEDINISDNKLFRCKLWLPPNSIINKEIIVNKF